MTLLCPDYDYYKPHLKCAVQHVHQLGVLGGGTQAGRGLGWQFSLADQTGHGGDESREVGRSRRTKRTRRLLVWRGGPRARQQPGPLTGAPRGQGGLEQLHSGGAGLQLLDQLAEGGRALLQPLAGLQVGGQQEGEDGLVGGQRISRATGVGGLLGHDVLGHDRLETLYEARVVFGQRLELVVNIFARAVVHQGFLLHPAISEGFSEKLNL